MRLPLLAGSYTARSPIAQCMRCVNYYPERNPEGSLVPFTHYQRPGLVPVAQGPVAPVRALYQQSDEVGGFTVIGQSVYYIDPNFALTLLGQLSVAGNGPCSFTDNGTSIVLVDGSSIGYFVDVATHTFGTITDGTHTFTGANMVDVIDGYVLWNIPQTPSFGSTLENTITFDGLFQGSKNGYPDLLRAIKCWKQQIFLGGGLKSEIWVDAGNPLFPFARLPGASIEHGVAAPFSVSVHDISVFLLAKNLQGGYIVLSQKGYETRRISNHAVELAIRKMAKTGTVADAIGYCYQQDGHAFYVLQFPTGNQTWVFDEAMGDPMMAWHQRAWANPTDGSLDRDRSNCHAFINGRNVVGDWQNGALYALDLDTYTDTVGGNVGAIQYIKTFPHVGIGRSGDGRARQLDGKRGQIWEFKADIECGNGPLDVNGNPAMISLRYSQDRGKTFNQAPLQSSGKPGEWLTQPKWPGLGIGRDNILELAHNIAGPAALNGGWVDLEVLEDVP